MALWRKVAETLITYFLGLAVLFITLAVFLVEERAEQRYGTLGFLLFCAGLFKILLIDLLRRRDKLFAPAAIDANAILRLSRPFSDRLAIVSCCWLVAVGCALASLGLSEFWGVFWSLVLAALFGGGAAFATSKLRSPVTLTLSPHGLDYSVFKTGPIAWPDILAANPAGVGRVRVITLHLADETKYLPAGRRLPGSWGNRFLLSTHFAIQSKAFDVSRSLIMTAINTRLSAFGRTESALHAKTA